MIRPEDRPGGTAAVACGCTCPTEQPQADENIWRADPGCPVHGLHMLAAELNAEQKESHRRGIADAIEAALGAALPGQER